MNSSLFILCACWVATSVYGAGLNLPGIGGFGQPVNHDDDMAAAFIPRGPSQYDLDQEHIKLGRNQWKIPPIGDLYAQERHSPSEKFSIDSWTIYCSLPLQFSKENGWRQKEKFWEHDAFWYDPKATELYKLLVIMDDKSKIISITTEDKPISKPQNVTAAKEDIKKYTVDQVDAKNVRCDRFGCVRDYLPVKDKNKKNCIDLTMRRSPFPNQEEEKKIKQGNQYQALLSGYALKFKVSKLFSSASSDTKSKKVAASEPIGDQPKFIQISIVLCFIFAAGFSFGKRCDRKGADDGSYYTLENSEL